MSNFKKGPMRAEPLPYSGPVSLTAHDLAVRRLSTLLDNIDYYATTARSPLTENQSFAVMVYYEYLLQVFIDVLIPLYEKDVMDMFDKLRSIRKEFKFKKDAEDDSLRAAVPTQVLDALIDINVEAMRLLYAKGLLFEKARPSITGGGLNERKL